MTQKQHKELTLIACVIVEEDLLKGTLFETFDKAYDIAKKFKKTFPEDTDWEAMDIDFDEAVIDFCGRQKLDGYKRL